MSTIRLVQGDNRPYITLTLSNPDGTPINLSEATTTVRVYFRKANTTTVLSTLVCSKPNGGADGKISFNFPGSTLDVPAGNYEGEITIDFNGEDQTVYDVLRFVVRPQFN